MAIFQVEEKLLLNKILLWCILRGFDCNIIDECHDLGFKMLSLFSELNLTVELFN